MKLQNLKKYKLFQGQELLDLKLLETQGLCNTNYKLKTSKQDYLIRVFKHTHNDKKRRKIEFKTQNKANKEAIASKAYLIDEKNNLMICDFIKGVHKPTLKNNDIKQLCKAMKKLHKIKTKQKPYNLKDDFKNYGKTLKDKESKKLIKESLKELKKIKKFKFEPALCHHDLNTQNILFCKNNKVKFIDWEFSCVNDIYFDLANVCVEYNLNCVKETQVLKSYFKRLQPNSTLKLSSYKLIYRNLWKLWFKAQK